MTHGFAVIGLRLRRVFVTLIAGATLSGFAAAQSPNATLRVTVVDPSGAVIVGATVTVTGSEPATRSVQVVPVQTAETWAHPQIRSPRRTLAASVSSIKLVIQIICASSRHSGMNASYTCGDSI